MRHVLLALTVLALTTGCSLKPFDPCTKGSPLQVDPKVKDACEAMETGGEDGEFVCVTSPAIDEYSICAPDTYDNNFWWLPLTTGDLPGSTVDHRECTPAVEYQAWADPSDNPQTQPDYLCANDGWTFTSPDGKAFALEEMPKSSFGYLRSLPTNGWADPSMTKAHVGLAGFSVFCPKGALCVKAKDDCFCKCESDLDCAAMTQSEAVCELGMCFYVDEPAAPSATPPGPHAYGFASWDEALTIEGDTITITPAFFAALLPGIFRDDQAFDAAGVITHCGRASLCHHLGLMVGDMAVADDDAVGQLLAGQSVEVDIIHADGSDRTVTVAIDFDHAGRSP